ncbi:MAG: 30S ribosomal protein S8 [Ignisphaera sp.]|nr:30S ribosomal protein S8 [Ignisphaera sp.]MCX8168495.1 30S ribosomal protein S8 [Ignisphaera sp.]MDW8085065.1 30S ribosomal protein S8 [Ignisphaera sp.]
MVMLDSLSNALTAITNAEMRRKSEVVVWPASKLVIRVLRVMQKHGYIGEFEYVDDGRWGKIVIQLLGRINRAGAIKPRWSATYRELLALPYWIRRYLPSRDIGILIISTSQGVVSHREAVEAKIGGILLAYVY